MLSCFSHVRLFVTLWTIAHQAPLPMVFSRQEYWSGLPWPSLEDLPNPGIEPTSPAFQVDSLPLNHQGNPLYKLWIRPVMLSLVTICYHAKLLQYYWLYYLCCIFYPHDSLFSNCKFLSLNFSYLFHLSRHPLYPSSLAIPLVYSLYLWDYLLHYVWFICFLDSTCNWNHICLSLTDFT